MSSIILEALLRDPLRSSTSSLLFPLDNNDTNECKVYTDGSCAYQGLENAKAGIGVFWGDDHPNNFHGKVHGLQDNNRAELCAAHHAINQAVNQEYAKIKILSDSEFVRLAIQNPNFFDKIAYIDYQDIIKSIKLLSTQIDISVEYVKAHFGIPGNEKADKLAKRGVRTISLESIYRYTKNWKKIVANRRKGNGGGKRKPQTGITGENDTSRGPPSKTQGANNNQLRGQALTKTSNPSTTNPTKPLVKKIHNSGSATSNGSKNANRNPQQRSKSRSTRKRASGDSQTSGPDAKMSNLDFDSTAPKVVPKPKKKVTKAKNPSDLEIMMKALSMICAAQTVKPKPKRFAPRKKPTQMKKKVGSQ